MNRTITTATVLALALALALSAVLLTGCAAGDEPVRDARETLGTIVTITAYGSDAEATQAAVDEAYVAMAAVDDALSVYATDTAPAAGTAAALNADPRQWTLLNAEATSVIERVYELDVYEYFRPTLFGVQTLYGFEEGGRIPDPEQIDAALRSASGFETRYSKNTEVLEARFAVIETACFADPELDESIPTVGVDFGGAAKGLGLDRAAAALEGSGDVEAAIVSAGSTTIAVGSKPDGTPWKIGIEDPRDPQNVVSVVESSGDIVVSTSGDYQRYFEIDGVRYHHILDPATGMPAPGTRTLTVVGTPSGLDSDILSTALFVMGPERARAYAEAEGLGLYIVDDEGRTLVTPGPDASFSFEDAR